MKVRIPVLVSSGGDWIALQVGEGYVGVSRPSSDSTARDIAEERRSMSGDGEAVHTYWIEAEVEAPEPNIAKTVKAEVSA